MLFMCFGIRSRGEFKAKALQLQSDGQDIEARKMLARAAEIEYKHVRDLIFVSARFFIRLYYEWQFA